MIRWQVENEPFLDYGECPKFDPTLLRQEVELVRSLDRRPIQLTVSGELDAWGSSAELADVLGISLYRLVWNDLFGYFIYPLSPEFYRLRIASIRSSVDKVVISELQAEPWFSVPIEDKPLEEWVDLFDADRMNESVEFAQQTGVDEVYLWGAEWWYHLRSRKPMNRRERCHKFICQKDGDLMLWSRIFWSCAVQAARISASVCLTKKLTGGDVRIRRVPSKALLKTANVYRQASQAKLFGTELGKLGFDFVSIMRYRQSLIDAVTGAGGSERYLRLLQKMQVTLVQGAAPFIDDHTVEVLGQHYFGSCFVIATGTVDFVPSIRGIDEIPLLSWKEALSTTRQPKSIATIGGGPVAVEIATFYSTFGTRVVILEPGKSILAREDVEIAALAQESLQLGVEIITNANILELIGRGGVFSFMLSQMESRSLG